MDTFKLFKLSFGWEVPSGSAGITWTIEVALESRRTTDGSVEIITKA